MNLCNDISNYIFLENKQQISDMIFVVGGTYPNPAELIKQGFSEYVLVSGKYSKKTGRFSGAASKKEKYNRNYLIESDFFKNVLMKNGVEENRIICEDKSMFTFENAMQARELTKDNWFGAEKGIETVTGELSRIGEQFGKIFSDKLKG